MGSSIKADHRLVQPQAKHYVQRTRGDGEVEDVLVGPYSIEQRNRYFKTMISLYMTRHPDAPHFKAKQATFVKWRNLIFSTIRDEYVPVAKAKAGKDAVKLLS